MHVLRFLPRAGRPQDPAPRTARRRAGVSLVELSLVTPILLLLTLGTVDLGRMFFDYIQLRGAAIEGATFGARNPSNTSGASSAASSSGVPSGTSISVSVDAACLVAGGTGQVRVTASSTFRPVTTGFLRSWWGVGNVNLSASSTMRCTT